MTILVIVGVCIILAVLAFFLPRMSRHPQRGVDSTLEAGQDAAGKAPGKAGDLLEKPFETLAQGRQQKRAEGARGSREGARALGPNSGTRLANRTA